MKHTHGYLSHEGVAYETTRKDGHGLGMWIVNNTVNMSGGKIQGIQGTEGFSAEFSIGGAL